MFLEIANASSAVFFFHRDARDKFFASFRTTCELPSSARSKQVLNVQLFHPSRRSQQLPNFLTVHPSRRSEQVFVLVYNFCTLHVVQNDFFCS